MKDLWTRYELIAVTLAWLVLAALFAFYATGKLWPAVVITLLVGLVIGLDHWPSATREWLSRPAFRRGFSLAAVLGLLGVRW